MLMPLTVQARVTMRLRALGSWRWLRLPNMALAEDINS